MEENPNYVYIFLFFSHVKEILSQAVCGRRAAPHWLEPHSCLAAPPTIILNMLPQVSKRLLALQPRSTARKDRKKYIYMENGMHVVFKVAS